MSLPGTKIPIWQPCTKHSGLGAQVSHLCSLNIPARHAGVAEVICGGFQKANKLLSVPNDLPKPGPPFQGLSKPSWLGTLSRLQVQHPVLHTSPGKDENSSERTPKWMQAEPMAGMCRSSLPQPSRLYNRMEKPQRFRQRPETVRALGGLGLCSAVPVTCRQPLGNGEAASQVRAEFTPYLYRGRANHLHMGKRRVWRRGGRLPVQGCGSDPS